MLPILNVQIYWLQRGGQRINKNAGQDLPTGPGSSERKSLK
jgi:hypothetical protein